MFQITKMATIPLNIQSEELYRDTEQTGEGPGQAGAGKTGSIGNRCKEINVPPITLWVWYNVTSSNLVKDSVNLGGGGG